MDSSGNGHDGAFVNTPVWTEGALEFNNNRDIVVDPDAGEYLNGLDAITISLSVKSDRTGTNRGFLSTVDPNKEDTHLGIRYDSRGNLGGGRDVIKVSLTTTKGTHPLIIRLVNCHGTRSLIEPRGCGDHYRGRRIGAGSRS